MAFEPFGAAYDRALARVLGTEHLAFDIEKTEEEKVIPNLIDLLPNYFVITLILALAGPMSFDSSPAPIFAPRQTFRMRRMMRRMMRSRHSMPAIRRRS